MNTGGLYLIVYGVLFGMLAPEAAGTEILKDPMRPPDYMATTGPMGDKQDGGRALSLSTTYVSEKSRHATINQRLVREGDEIGGARIISIGPGVVILEREGEEISLSVLPPGLKKPHGEIPN